MIGFTVFCIAAFICIVLVGYFITICFFMALEDRNYVIIVLCIIVVLLIISAILIPLGI